MEDANGRLWKMRAACHKPLLSRDESHVSLIMDLGITIMLSLKLICSLQEEGGRLN